MSCTCHSKSGKEPSTSLKDREVTDDVKNPLFLEDTTTAGVDSRLCVPPWLGLLSSCRPLSHCAAPQHLPLFKGKPKSVSIRPLAGVETFFV